MLIDATYFKGEILIAGRERLAVQENIEAFIEKYEPKILNSLLGEDFNTLFQAGILEDPIAAKWQILRDDTDLKAIIANYVYYQIMENAKSQTSGVGETNAKAENAIVVNSDGKMLKAWNEMVRYCYKLNKYLLDNTSTYPEWVDTYVLTDFIYKWDFPEVYKFKNRHDF